MSIRARIVSRVEPPVLSERERPVSHGPVQLPDVHHQIADTYYSTEPDSGYFTRRVINTKPKTSLVSIGVLTGIAVGLVGFSIWKLRGKNKGNK